MDKEWTIAEVGNITDSEYGKRFNVKLEGYDAAVSGFTKWPEKIVDGAKIFGHIEVKGQYHNFKFGKKDSSPAERGSPAASAEIKNLITLKLIPMLEVIRKDQIAILSKLEMVDKEDDFEMPKF